MATGNLKKAALRSIACLCILLAIGSASLSLGYQPAAPIHRVFGAYGGSIGPDTIAKIVSVLEIRSSDRRILHKAAEKLWAMNNRDIRLISSLCDRISADGGTAGADIAFSLVTAMIVLS